MPLLYQEGDRSRSSVQDSSDRGSDIRQVRKHHVGLVMPELVDAPVAGGNGDRSRATGPAASDVARRIAHDHHVVDCAAAGGCARPCDRYQLVPVTMIRAEGPNTQVETLEEPCRAQLELGRQPQIACEDRLQRSGVCERVDDLVHPWEYLYTGAKSPFNN